MYKKSNNNFELFIFNRLKQIYYFSIQDGVINNEVNRPEHIGDLISLRSSQTKKGARPKSSNSVKTNKKDNQRESTNSQQTDSDKNKKYT